jgi:hypothetical protein
LILLVLGGSEADGPIDWVGDSPFNNFQAPSTVSMPFMMPPMPGMIALARSIAGLVGLPGAGAGGSGNETTATGSAGPSCMSAVSCPMEGA